MLLLRYGPALALALTLAAPSAEAVVAPWTGEAQREEIVVPAGSGPLVADLYHPPRDARPARAVLVVHGLSAAGRRQPDLARLARLLARHGQLVLVPAFDGLAMFRLTGREVIQIRSAIAELKQRAPAVGIAAFSFGAGPAMLAAADVPDLRYVASFGGYADLRNVIAFLSAGVHEFNGARHRGPAEPYNRWKLAALLVPFVESTADRQRLATIVHRKLLNPADDTSALAAGLGPEGKATLALALNDRADAVERLLAGASTSVQSALDALSPLPALARVQAPILLAHGIGDSSIPYTESLRLAAAGGSRARLTLLRTFHHTGPAARAPYEFLLDALNLVALADRILSL